MTARPPRRHWRRHRVGWFRAFQARTRVPCDFCQARVGEQCTTASGGPAEGIHLLRLAALEEDERRQLVAVARTEDVPVAGDRS